MGRSNTVLIIDLFISLVFSLAVFLVCLIFDACSFRKELMFFLALPVIAIGGRRFFMEGFRQLISLKGGLDLLISIGAGTAFLLSAVNTFYPHLIPSGKAEWVYYEPAVIIITLWLTGIFVRRKTLDRSLRQLEKKWSIKPSLAIIVTEEGEQKISPDNIKPGNVLLVRKGEIIPVDGKIIEGRTTIDESIFKGAAEVYKYPGEVVSAGTLNKGNEIKIEAEKTGSEMLISKLKATLSKTDFNKELGLKETNLFASGYLLFLLLAAAICFVVWLFVLSSNLNFSFITALEVIIAGTPCALSIAIPFTVGRGLEKLVSKGVLVKDGSIMERLGTINTLVVGKSGILTEEKFRISDFIWKGTPENADLKNILYSIEKEAQHIHADSFAKYLSSEGATAKFKIKDVEHFDGRGVRAKIENEIYYIGTDSFIGMINHGRFFKSDEYMIHEVSGMEYFFDDKELLAQISKLRESGKAVLLACNSKAVFAIIGLGEGAKNTTKESLEVIRKSGVDVVLMTSDSRESSLAVAEKLHIKEVAAEVLPFSKADKIREFQQKGKAVAMAGTEFEDEPALAQSDAGISVVNGNDLPVVNAQAVIVSGGIDRIAELLKYGKSWKRKIGSALFLAILFNIAGILIASGLLYPIAGITLTSGIATLVMALGTFAVVLNSLK
jgi:Cu2+-exporting ATPase